MERRAKHYEHMNEEVLKRLNDFHLEGAPQLPDIDVPRRLDFFRRYMFAVDLPTDSYFYDMAILHLNLSGSQGGDILTKLPKRVKEHNEKAASIEVDVWKKLIEALDNRKVKHDYMSDAFFEMLRLLTRVWSQFVITGDSSRVLPYFQREYPRRDEGSLMYFGDLMVWTEHAVGERERVADAIRSVLTDTDILSRLEGLDHSEYLLQEYARTIAKEARKISRAIEADAYSGKANCCPTVFTLIRDYLF